MAEKTIWDGVLDYFNETHLDINRRKYYEAWPVVAGINLSSCTHLQSYKPEEGKIYVKTDSISAKSLLMMQRKRIINDWNKIFPDAEIKEVVVAKRS